MAGLPIPDKTAITPTVDLTGSAGLADRALAEGLSGASRDLRQFGDALAANYQAAQSAVHQGQLASLGNQINDMKSSLAAEHRTDPQGFVDVSTAERSAFLSKLPGSMAPEAAIVWDREFGAERDQIRDRRAALDIGSAKSALETRRGILKGQLSGYQRQGIDVATSPDAQATIAELTRVETDLGNPMFGSSPEEASARIASTNSWLKTGATLSQADQLYDTQGLAAAKAFVQKTADDPTLPLTAADRLSLRNDAFQELNLRNQARIETERAARQAERDQRDAQRDAFDGLQFSILTGQRFGLKQLGQMELTGQIDTGQVNRALQLQRAEDRRAKSETRAASTESRLALIEAAGGDKTAVSRATRAAARGIITKGELEGVAAAYATSQSDPALAEASDYLARTLGGKTGYGQDHGDPHGAVAELMRWKAMGQIPPGQEHRFAEVIAKKYADRGNSTLPIPLTLWRQPKSTADIAAGWRLLKKDLEDGKITKPIYDAESVKFRAWQARIDAAPKPRPGGQ